MNIQNGRVSGVRFVPANSSGAALTPSLIVVHDTAGRLDKFSSVNWFASKGCKTSAHFVVELDGTITQMVRTDRRAFHAGQSKWKGRSFCNAFSIGIEIVNPGQMKADGTAWFGKATNEPLTKKKTKEHGDGYWMPYPPAQVAAVKKLCRALMEEYPDCNEIVTHWQISPGRKIDTNPLFPLAEVLAYAEGHDDPPVETPSDIPVIRLPEPSPVPVADATTVVKASRKARRLSRVKNFFHSLWLSVVGFTGADSLSGNFAWAKGTLDDIKIFVSDHAAAITVLGAIVGIFVVRNIIDLLVEDAREGRYLPSGMADAVAGTARPVLEPSGAVPAVGQEE
jgi:N-acetylmuramoyl-L-alanine amidase